MEVDNLKLICPFKFSVIESYSSVLNLMVVIIATNYDLKFQAFQSQFRRYGIQLIQHRNSYQSPDTIFSHYSNHTAKISAIIKEKTLLARTDNLSQQAKIKHLAMVIHQSQLDAWILTPEGTWKQYHTQASVPGYLDLTKKTRDPTVFGWDDIFVALPHHRTYHELLTMGLKISAREQVISNYIREFIHYKSPITLCHAELPFRRPMEFNTQTMRQMMAKLITDNPALKTVRIDRMISQVFNQGVMFRSPHTRRTKMFWFPLLNAGIPLTPKSDDPIHEMTYLIHDFGHFLIPDLIFTGTNPNPVIEAQNRQIYVWSRMMSEAITIILADMLFIWGLTASGTTYLTCDQRQIYPLFRDFKIDFNCKSADLFSQLEPILSANVLYVITGDDSALRKLLRSDTDANLTAYKTKYSKFFAADYHWTIRNYECMQQDSVAFQSWWAQVSVINQKYELGLQTIDQFRQSLSSCNHLEPTTLIWKIYDQIIGKYIHPCFAYHNNLIPVSANKALTRAFARYLMGQLFFFHKYAHITSIKNYSHLILNLIIGTKKNQSFTEELIDRVRAFYDQMITQCASEGFITEDDAINYKEVFPLVEPYYISYTSENTSIESIYKEMTSITCHESD